VVSAFQIVRQEEHQKKRDSWKRQENDEEQTRHDANPCARRSVREGLDPAARVFESNLLARTRLVRITCGEEADCDTFDCNFCGRSDWATARSGSPAQTWRSAPLLLTRGWLHCKCSLGS
jgi:hypothetical protein